MEEKQVEQRLEVAYGRIGRLMVDLELVMRERAALASRLENVIRSMEEQPQQDEPSKDE